MSNINIMKQDIIPFSSEKFCHAPALMVLPNENLLCVWYAGSFECASNQAIYMANGERVKDGWIWGRPRKIVDTKGHADGNPVFFFANNEIHLFFVTLQGKAWDTAILRTVKSKDGIKWEGIKELSREQGVMCRNKPLALFNGEWLLPLYDEKEWTPLFWLSGDKGKTWREISRVKSPRRIIQPAIIEIDGVILALCRSGEGRIFEMQSFDGGKNWTEPTPTLFLNPNSAIDLAVADGHLFLAFNNSAKKRSPLCLAKSVSNGSWKIFFLENANDGEFCYPSLVATSKEVHCVYTVWQGGRMAIRYAWLPTI